MMKSRKHLQINVKLASGDQSSFEDFERKPITFKIHKSNKVESEKKQHPLNSNVQNLQITNSMPMKHERNFKKKKDH
jgi:hypothetical protein